MKGHIGRLARLTVTDELISLTAIVVWSGWEYVALQARAHALTSIARYSEIIKNLFWACRIWKKLINPLPVMA